jgi:NNP family nitrate/nitrite transporter-like MFS transporter
MRSQESGTSDPRDGRKAIQVLTLNTIAFTVNFACWMLYGVLITFFIKNRLYDFDRAAVGWLIGIPVLTGSVLRLPVGLLTDIYGGRKVYSAVMVLAAIPMFLLSFADGFWAFFVAGLGFGLCGTSFAVGIAYTSVWFRRERQGLALGIFGAGNAGAALTTLIAPALLTVFTSDGDLEGWRTLPRVYAGLLLGMTIVFWLLTFERKLVGGEGKSMAERLEPLKNIRVWRFGLYYFLVFGGFVALAQWLVPYYVNVYTVSIATAGLLTSIFSLPSGLIRALGGWMSDRWGARPVMYWVLGTCLVASVLLWPPVMSVASPGEGITALRDGTVTEINETTHIIVVDNDTEYPYDGRDPVSANRPMEDGAHILPVLESWQEPAVELNQRVTRGELVVRGVSQIHFQAHIVVFTFLVFVVGIAMGIGKAAVYKHIPEHFPDDIGVVGGIVGVLGGLGGFVCPVIFGYLLEWTGLWTMTWVFFAMLSAACLVWMHLVIRGIMKRKVPHLMRDIEESDSLAAGA